MGLTYVNRELTKTFTIANDGTANVVITSITISDHHFSVVEQPTTIAPGTFERLIIKLTSDVPDNYSARVMIQYATDSFEFGITGEVKNSEINAFNAVTPNGDGIHEYFKIMNIELYPGNSVTIINRLGETIYKMNDYNNDDPERRFAGQGNTGPGQALIDGTYFYIIDIGADKKTTGFLLLQK